METPLSAVLPTTPRSVRRLVLSNRGITAVDTLPLVFKSLEFLDISRNAIRSLAGLRSLTRLRVLLAMENSVEALSELSHLSPLQELEEADFTGNPVTAYFVYRDVCILTCGKLALLDGAEVSEEEAMEAQRRTTQREKLIDLIVRNEETISKLEHLQNSMKVHAEMIAKNFLVDYSPGNIAKILTAVSLNWPESLIFDIRDSLELKVSERLSDANSDWEPLYFECLDKQKEFIDKLMTACERLAEKSQEVWEGRATHMRDWSLGPRNSTADLGLGTLGQELESVLSEHRHLQETTVLQQRQLAAILARNEELEEHLSLLKTKSGETAAMHSTIDEGITFVVERFRDQHRLKHAFDKLTMAVFAMRRRKLLTEEIAERQRNDVGTLCFAAWKWATKIEKFINLRDTERNESTARKTLLSWSAAARMNQAARGFLMQRKLRLLQKIIQAWGLYPLLVKDLRLKLDSAVLQYSRELVLRVLRGWRRLSCRLPQSRYWRDIHSEKLQMRSLLVLRTNALLTRSQTRKSMQSAQRSLIRKAFFALRSFIFLTGKKRHLLQRIHEFVTLKTLKRLRRFQMKRRKSRRGKMKAQQCYLNTLYSSGFKALALWCELSKEQRKRLVRILNRTNTHNLRAGLLTWRAEAIVPDFMNHTMSVVICKRGYLMGRKVMKHWKRVSKLRKKLYISEKLWQSRTRLKGLSKCLTTWLVQAMSSFKNRLSDVKSETMRLENSLTSRESEVKHLQSSNQKLRFQLEEQTQLQESPESKRTFEDLTSRPDARKVHLLESEVSALRNELSTLRGQKTDRTSVEGLKKELASARALCTSLTSELQKTTAALQSQQAEFHMQANELTEQLTEARSQLQKTTKENREMKEKLKNKEGFYLDLSRTQESSRLGPEMTVSPRLTLDSEERRVRQQLESLKRERTAIRGEIESRLRDLEDSRSAMSTPGPTLSSLGELSVRLSQLESRMTSSRH